MFQLALGIRGLSVPEIALIESLIVCSNVLPMEVELNKDYFTESSRSALRAIFATWSLEKCRDW